LPAGELGWRNEHREIRLARRARERAGDEVRLALGRNRFEQHHVLGEPALLVSVIARDAQREAFLAEQRVAAVAGADRPDHVVLPELTDIAALRIAIRDRVHAAVERRRSAEAVDRELPA